MLNNKRFKSNSSEQGELLPTYPSDKLLQHWFRGGMPSSFLSPDDNTSSLWKKEYLGNLPYSSVFREELGGSTHILSRLISVLPRQSGGLLSFSNISRALEVSSSTAKWYVDILSAAGFIRLLEPFSPSHGRALRMIPKLYIRDSGLLSWLVGIQSQGELVKHEMLHLLWGAYVIEQLAERIYKAHRENLVFWRDRSGMELDALWQHEGTLIGIDIQAKTESTVTKSMRVAVESLGVSQIVTIYLVKKLYGICR